MRPSDEWPVIAELGRRRTKDEITSAMNDKLNRELVGVSWNFSQYSRRCDGSNVGREGRELR